MYDYWLKILVCLNFHITYLSQWDTDKCRKLKRFRVREPHSGTLCAVLLKRDLVKLIFFLFDNFITRNLL